jgi:hypothetical protein
VKYFLSSIACLEERVLTPQHGQVQGKTPVVRFEMNEAYKYMVQILGRKEQIPRRFGDVTEGAVEILMCLKLRYGDGYTLEIISLLVWHLTICKDDQEIWGNWREKFAARSVRMLLHGPCLLFMKLTLAACCAFGSRCRSRATNPSME